MLKFPRFALIFACIFWTSWPKMKVLGPSWGMAWCYVDP